MEGDDKLTKLFESRWIIWKMLWSGKYSTHAKLKTVLSIKMITHVIETYLGHEELLESTISISRDKVVTHNCS